MCVCLFVADGTGTGELELFKENFKGRVREREGGREARQNVLKSRARHHTMAWSSQAASHRESKPGCFVEENISYSFVANI